MTVLPYITPTYGEATALSGLLALVQSFFILLKFYKHINWKNLLPILITFIIVSYFAVQGVTTIGDVIIKKILGLTLIFASIYFFFISERIHIQPKLPTQIGLGTLSGIMGGFFAMQGPPAVLYFLSSSKTKEEYIAQSQIYFLLGNILMTLFRFQNGFVTMTVGKLWLIAIVAVFIGSNLGRLVFNKISIGMLRKISYAYMALSGLFALLA